MKKPDDLFLKENPTLKDFQDYVRHMEEDRGFTEQGLLEKCLMLGEEVGELFKAIRKKEKIKVDHNSKFGSVDEELADILIFLCTIANRFSIDLEKAFRDKEEVNKKRIWKKNEEE
jgi:NTP pyrophosphatase (non-canonical NTP hydrolase)